MSTSYGFACAEHATETDLYAAQGTMGRESLAAIWRIRGPLAEMHGERAVVQRALLEGHRWFGIDGSPDALEHFAVEHAGCAVEVVSEYGDRELADDVLDGIQAEHPDADELARRALDTVLGTTHGAAALHERAAAAIVDALDGQRMLSWRHRPARLKEHA